MTFPINESEPSEDGKRVETQEIATVTKENDPTLGINLIIDEKEIKGTLSVTQSMKDKLDFALGTLSVNVTVDETESRSIHEFDQDVESVKPQLARTVILPPPVKVEDDIIKVEEDLLDPLALKKESFEPKGVFNVND